MIRKAARIEKIDDSRYAVFTPYEYKDDIKAIPSARWSSNSRCWVVEVWFLDRAERLVRFINQENGDLETPEGYEELEAALDALFDALPPNLRRRTHRALVSVFHPDHEGDINAMKVLNNVRGNRSI